MNSLISIALVFFSLNPFPSKTTSAEEDLIRHFYESFQKLDGESMAACYHDSVVFEDPAFGELKGEHPGNMWRMLCESQKEEDFRVEFEGIEFDGEKGKAHWEAFYFFGKKKRPVHNIIEASFLFRDGKIVDHRDSFDLKKWAKQALGLTGSMLGGTKFFRKTLQERTHENLAEWEQEKAASVE